LLFVFFNILSFFVSGGGWGGVGGGKRKSSI